MNGTQFLVDDRNKYRSFWVRAYSSLWMLTAVALILYLGHLFIWATLVIIQIIMSSRRQAPTRLLNWHFFFTAMHFVYGTIIKKQLVNEVFEHNPNQCLAMVPWILSTSSHHHLDKIEISQLMGEEEAL